MNKKKEQKEVDDLKKLIERRELDECMNCYLVYFMEQKPAF